LIAFVVRRLLSLLPTLVGISLIAFFLLNLVPSDPVLTWSAGGRPPSAEALRHLEAELRIDRHPALRYLDWVGALLKGDLGHSLKDGRPVATIVAEALPWTLLLNAWALLAIYGLALPFGYLGAQAPGSIADRLGGWVLLWLYAVPAFAAALVLQQLLSVQLRILPLQGVGDPHSPTSGIAAGFDLARHLILPAFCLALSGWAFVARYSRAAFRSVIGRAFLVMARARGSSRTRAALHVAAGSAVSFVTLFGALLPGLVSGSVIVEQVFSWPGLGRLYLAAVQARDYPVVLGLTLLSAVAVLIGQLVVDLLYLLVDPRTRVGLVGDAGDG
jgi:peptide/nickel transport system permease protein